MFFGRSFTDFDRNLEVFQVSEMIFNLKNKIL
jgi:hypothetical protein